MKSKIFTLLGLAALAVPVLASCGGNNGKQVKPGVYFFAEASSIEYENNKVSYKKERYRDTECAIVEVENGDNLKYGEQDVVVTIRPQTLFTFKEWDYEEDADKQTWKQRGKASRPYVGLGSPTNLYSYELAENVAWTFEDLSETKDSGYQVEKYKITVKKEFFKRNIVIAYGVTDGHPVFVHTSEHYKTNIKVKDAGGNDLTNPMWAQFFSKPDSSDSAFGPGDGMIFTFSANQNSGNNNVGMNSLIGFDSSWEDIVLDEKNPDPDNPTIYTYANFDVYGLKHDKEGKPIEESKVLLSKVDKTENNYFHFTRTGGPDYDDDSSSSATFYVPWPKIIGEEYSVLYDEIQLRLKKMPVLTDVSVKSTNVAYVESGYFNLTKDSADYYNRFYNNHFGFTYKDSYYTVNADGKNKVKEGIPEFINEKQKSEIGLSYGALIVVQKEKLNSVVLTFSGDKEAEGRSSILLHTKSTKTTWRSKAFNIGGEQKDYELEYWLVNDWYLVKLNTSNVTSEFFGIDKICISNIGDADIFYLYPNPKPKYGSDPFAYTRETGEKADPADKLEITISAAS